MSFIKGSPVTTFLFELHRLWRRLQNARDDRWERFLSRLMGASLEAVRTGARLVTPAAPTVPDAYLDVRRELRRLEQRTIADLQRAMQSTPKSMLSSLQAIETGRELRSTALVDRAYLAKYSAGVQGSLGSSGLTGS